MSGSGKAAGGVVGKLIKAPWKYTGPTASPEFLQSLTKAGEYRPVAPTNIPPAIVPTAEPDRIYDIKYFSRDDRRIDLGKKEEHVPLSVLRAEALAQELPPTPSTWYTWGKEVPVLDTPGDGYQI